MSRDIDQLFSQLKQTEPYLNDDGFSGRVWQRAQLSASTRTSRLQLPILLIATLVGTALCFSFTPIIHWIGLFTEQLLTGFPVAAILICGLVMAFVSSCLLASEKI